jgi:hypothetical protein
MIALQVLLLALLPLLLWRLIRVRGGPQSFVPIDIGIVFASIVAVYGALPLIGLSLAFAGIGAIQEARLGETLPEAQDVVAVGWMFVMLLAGFVLAYGFTRRHHRLPSATPALPVLNSRNAIAALLLFAFIQAGLAAIRAAYSIGPGADYLDSYAVVRDQPLLVQQLVGVLAATDFAAAVLFIVVTLAWRPRWHGWVALFVVVLLAQTFITGGSRGYAFRCGLAYVVARSICGPRVRLATALSLGLLGLLAFLAAGAIRQTGLDGEPLSVWSLFQGGEFMAFFYNGLDLHDKAADIRELSLNGALYLVDLLRLVPRQIIGDFKVDPAAFYASTFYPDLYESGGAFAFGAIAESALGFGAPEALVRGALLGLAYGFVRRLLDGKRLGIVGVFAYTWFLVIAYEGLRDTTFTAFPRFVLQVLPLLIIVRLLGILKPAKMASAPLAATPSPRTEQA